MTTIKLNSLEISNFMGYSKCNVDFDKDITEIFGETGNGKTSIEMAWRWVLGLNIEDFAPKIDGYRIKDIVTEVSASISVNDITYTLKRTSQQKYDKKSGEFAKNEYSYEFDGQPIKANNYQASIEDLFTAKFDKFDLLLSLKGFNEDKLPKWTWKNKRAELFGLVDVDSKVSKLNDLPKYDLISDDLIKGKDENAIQTILNFEKKQIADRQELNKHDIQKNNENIVEFAEIKFDVLKVEKEVLQDKLAKLQASKLQSSKNAIIERKTKELTNYQLELTKIINSDNIKAREYNDSKYRLDSEIRKQEQEIKTLNDKLVKITYHIEDWGIEIEYHTSLSFDESDSFCPQCKQVLPQAKKDELVSVFEKNKTASIVKAKSRVSSLTVESETVSSRVIVATECLSGLKSKLDGFNDIVPKTNTDSLENTIQSLMTEIETIKYNAVKVDMANEIKACQQEYDDVVGELAKEKILQKYRENIECLKQEIKKLANNEKIRQQKQEQLNDYIQTKVNFVNSEVGKHFDNIGFNFFKWNSSNAQNVFDCTCECVYQGTVYASQSTGQRIFSDLAVNNGLQKLYGVSFPQFLDNFQDITLDIGNEHQQIRMSTSKNESISAVRIKDCYTLADCGVKGE